tara:strand:+ start:374 stop:574 length:201 start_codon:yes stop_codon:yes gene_type:complete
MTVDLQQLLEAASGERIGRQSDSANHFLAMIDRVFGKTYTETDPVQAAAIRQIMHREGPINPVSGS